MEGFENFSRPSKRKSPTPRDEPPPKKKKIERDQISSLTARIEELERKNQELERNKTNSDFQICVLQQQNSEQSKRIDEEEEEKRIRKRRSGICISLGDIEEKVRWFRTKNVALHQQLFAELSGRLVMPSNCPSVKFTPENLLDLLFFTFSTGLPMETIAKSFYVNDATISNTTLTRWFDKTLDDLLPWAKEQIYFLSDKEWIDDSWKIYSQEKYQKFWNTLFYFVDGTVVEVNDTQCPLTSRTFRNGKHSVQAIVFFVVVSPRGRIVYVSKKFEGGSIHDKTHWENEKVAEKLAQKYLNCETEVDGKKYKREIGGDKAYPYASKPDGWVVRVTKTAEETKEVNEKGEEVGEKAKDSKLQDVEFDPAIARLRGVVERTIQRIKSWPIFHNPTCCSNVMRTYKMIMFSCGLVNWFLLNNNIQQI